MKGLQSVLTSVISPDRSGMALNPSMWSAPKGLRPRWDESPARSPHSRPFARFTLVSVGSTQSVPRPRRESGVRQSHNEIAVSASSGTARSRASWELERQTNLHSSLRLTVDASSASRLVP